MLSSVLHSERAIQFNIGSHKKERLEPAWLKKTLPALKRPLISDAWLRVGVRRGAREVLIFFGFVIQKDKKSFLINTLNFRFRGNDE